MRTGGLFTIGAVAHGASAPGDRPAGHRAAPTSASSGRWQALVAMPDGPHGVGALVQRGEQAPLPHRGRQRSPTRRRRSGSTTTCGSRASRRRSPARSRCELVERGQAVAGGHDRRAAAGDAAVLAPGHGSPAAVPHERPSQLHRHPGLPGLLPGPPAGLHLARADHRLRGHGARSSSRRARSTSTRTPGRSSSG